MVVGELIPAGLSGMLSGCPVEWVPCAHPSQPCHSAQAGLGCKQGPPQAIPGHPRQLGSDIPLHPLMHIHIHTLPTSCFHRQLSISPSHTRPPSASTPAGDTVSPWSLSRSPAPTRWTTPSASACRCTHSLRLAWLLTAIAASGTGRVSGLEVGTHSAASTLIPYPHPASTSKAPSRRSRFPPSSSSPSSATSDPTKGMLSHISTCFPVSLHLPTRTSGRVG